MTPLRSLVIAAAVLCATSANAAKCDFDTKTVSCIFASVEGYSFRTESGNTANAALAFVGEPNSVGTAPTGSQAGGQRRQFTTVGLNLSRGGSISFDFLIGTSGSNSFGYFENVDAASGENFRLSYSVDGGMSFDEISFISANAASYLNRFSKFSATIPVLAQTASTVLQFAQLDNSGSPYDHWAVDNVEVDTPPVPLPAALPLVATGLGAFALAGWRRRRVSA